MSSTTTQIPKWNIKADYVEVCNCDFGCPCNFSGFPTGGFCRGMALFHVQKGSYGQNISLNGLDAIYSASWPKAIHEGNGTLQFFITKKANEQQRKALTSILSGQAKGEGLFALLAGTFKYFLEPQFVDINANIDGKRSSFSIPDVMDVQIENFTNPVTGEEQDTKVQLPKGPIWKTCRGRKVKDNAYYNTKPKF